MPGSSAKRHTLTRASRPSTLRLRLTACTMNACASSSKQPMTSSTTKPWRACCRPMSSNHASTNSASLNTNEVKTVRSSARSRPDWPCHTACFESRIRSSAVSRLTGSRTALALAPATGGACPLTESHTPRLKPTQMISGELQQPLRSSNRRRGLTGLSLRLGPSKGVPSSFACRMPPGTRQTFAPCWLFAAFQS